MITVNAAFGQTAKALGLIGRKDENGTRQIAFDCADILAEYPEAEIICVFRRACDRDAYIAKASTSGKTLTVAVTDADVAVPGVLQIELRAIVGQAVRKSAMYTAQVDDSLRGLTEKPGSPAADMLNRLGATLERAEESVSAADQAAKRASDAATAAQDVAEAVQAKIDNGELKGDKGDPGDGVDVVGATIGQIVKIAAVDGDGRPTAWEPVDMPSGGGNLRWQRINSLTLTEQTNAIIISQDANGVPVSDYKAVAMKVEFDVPADSTQTSTNGSPWIYPTSTSTDVAVRAIGNLAMWQNRRIASALLFVGDADGIVATGNVQFSLVPSTKITVMDGVRLYINASSVSADHWPTGTKVSLEVLSERD